MYLPTINLFLFYVLEKWGVNVDKGYLQIYLTSKLFGEELASYDSWMTMPWSFLCKGLPTVLVWLHPEVVLWVKQRIMLEDLMLFIPVIIKF